MGISRRDVLQAGGGAASLAAALEIFAGTNASAATPASTAIDQDTLKFWSSEASKPYTNFKKGLHPAGGPSYVPDFIYYDQAKNVFQPSGAITDTDLPPKGSVDVNVRVQRVRPSSTSAALFQKAQSGTLRIDLKQTASMPGLPEALAWSAIAALVPTAAKSLPDLKDLTFDPGTSWGKLQKIPLSNGLGFWNWNFFLTKQESPWGRLVSAFRTAQPIFPLLGMPGIAITALEAVDKVLGWWQAQDSSDWLFKSVDSPVYATKEGKDALGFGGLALKKGQYLVIPKDQRMTFGNASDSLELQDGYLVAKNTKPFDWPDNASKQIPSVDYLSLYVDVKPSSAAPTSG
jgi:hypothetical protein